MIIIKIKMRFWVAVEKILRQPALFFVWLHRLATERVKKVIHNPEVHERLIKILLSSMKTDLSVPSGKEKDDDKNLGETVEPDGSGRPVC